MIKPSEIHIDEHQIFEQKLVSAFGLDDYKYIFATAAAVDVSKDADFQRKFNFYYRVRRDAQWRNEYYRIYLRRLIRTADLAGRSRDGANADTQ